MEDATKEHAHREQLAHNPFAPPRPHYSWKLLHAGPLKLDGGSMFGVVPKAIWGKYFPADEQNRIDLAHNCLLLERGDDDINLAEGDWSSPLAPSPGTPGEGWGEGHSPSNGSKTLTLPSPGVPGEGKNARDGADGGDLSQPRFVLIEAGSGDKFDAKTRAIFGLTDRCVSTAVEQSGVACDQIDAVILTHLHFDHCGGVTRRVRAGETAGWILPGADPSAGVKRAFPNAPIYVQRREWEDAITNRAVMTRTYLRENLEPIRDCVKLLDAPPAFPPGVLPGKDQAPAAALIDRVLHILPGICVFSVPGHTWGQQAVCFTDDRGRTVVFTPDLIPTVHHVGAAYNMAYDVEPYISTVTRRWFLECAAREDWLLVLDHEPGSPLCRVRPDGKGWYRLEPPSAEV